MTKVYHIVVIDEFVLETESVEMRIFKFPLDGIAFVMDLLTLS